ncbi:GNAT family N-acetyltransferase [Flammeovirga agarivorans]|uniref:GNAT family N-acetyltransferase n=1 Tax=Flammeovirga agarivorans TaxID=2726742 RepID=A0A7X8SQX9_9BACT|nr:GNAT family N-acetyltransferase [Flammeovirga agarivorans]NLR94659.1 GNAT family N-acetyltransferase [Flammeovirga agarivorans]
MAYITIPVKTTYLEITEDKIVPFEFKNKVAIERWIPENVDEYLTLYKQVGDDWGWTGRILMPQDELKKWLFSENCVLYILRVDNDHAGFIEFDLSQENKAEIVYFGLLKQFIGRQLGLPFLSQSTEMMFKKLQIEDVWLHTCEYDHPSAIRIYQKLGFYITQETIDEEPYDEDFLKAFKEKYS